MLRMTCRGGARASHRAQSEHAALRLSLYLRPAESRRPVTVRACNAMRGRAG